jgi:hypothetical protein
VVEAPLVGAPKIRVLHVIGEEVEGIDSLEK